MTSSVNASTPQISALLRGDPDILRAWIERWDARRFADCIITIVIGAGLYGAAMGYWRAPFQGLFFAVKFPFILLFTTPCNAPPHPMLPPFLGLNIHLPPPLPA